MLQAMTNAQHMNLVVLTERPERGSGETKRTIAQAAARATGVPASRIEVRYEAEYLQSQHAAMASFRQWSPGAEPVGDLRFWTSPSTNEALAEALWS